MTSQMSVALVSKSLGFHGLPLQKIWEGERGDSDLARIGVSNVDYTPYQLRQKHFSFQDRAKRLKLHQFIAKKAPSLFNTNLMDGLSALASQSLQSSVSGMCAITPTFDTFLSDRMDKNARLQHIYSLLQPGDIVYATVYSKVTSGMIVRLLCTGLPCVRILTDLNAKAFLPNSESIQAIDRKGVSRNFITNDCVCCEVLDVLPESEKMVVGLKGKFASQSGSDRVLGLAPTDSLPDLYKLSLDGDKESYEQILESSTGFRNPHCIEYLAQTVGLDISTYYTNMSGLRGRFPTQEYGSELRQVQASQWAFRSVAEGIEHFKEGRHSEAFQCLNKALNIDPRNVEGLVARGALYANSGSFKKAVDDFETALKLNQNHANARKYMGETLVALGRSYEEENKIEEAKKAYQDCLVIIPRHEEAQNSLEFLWSKMGTGSGKQLIEPNELTLPALNLKIAEQNREAGGSGTTKKDDRKDKKSKKKKSRSRKRRSSSSDSSSDSSDSSDSSSGSSSSSDSSSSDDSDQQYKKKTRRSKARQKSLSPLSKRMALMAGDQSNSAGGGGVGFDMANSYNFNQPYAALAQQTGENEEYEARVRKFLELTRDEDNYEDKVRKFVEEAAKYRKDRKTSDERAAKKKEKRKSRKMKKDSKKKRKDKRSKSGKKDKDDLIGKESMELREALKIFKNLPVFDMSAKLTSVEKSLSLLHEQEESHQLKEDKWKMMFAKNDRKAAIATATGSTASKLIPKQYAFGNDDDDLEADRSFGGITRGGATVGPSSAAELLASSLSRQKGVELPKKQRPPTPPPSISQRLKAQGPQPPKAPAGQVVLDKFGSFRLASTEKPLPPPSSSLASTRARASRSRSRSRRRYTSDSRSRSRSPKRRSRSRSYTRRRGGGSRSRSYNRSRSRSRSYSRSRSGSRDRRRSDRYVRGGRGGWNDRGTYYKPRFGNSRGGRGGIINNRGGFRDTRNFRPSRGLDRYRGGWGGKRIATGSKFRSRRSRSDSIDWKRSSYDDLRDSERKDGERSERDERSQKKDSKTEVPLAAGDGGKEKPSASGAAVTAAVGGGDASLEEIEKIIDKAKKEKKDDMIERNKDLLKKTPIW